MAAAVRVKKKVSTARAAVLRCPVKPVEFELFGHHSAAGMQACKVSERYAEVRSG
jgi:hypothetical protein